VLGDTMTDAVDPIHTLQHEFTVLESHLAWLRSGAEGGMTALRLKLDRLSVAALAANSHGAYVAVNRAAAALTGFSVDELQTMSVWHLTPSPDVETGKRLWAMFLTTSEQQGIYTLQGKHGPVTAAYVARAHVLRHVHVSLLTAV
jgi:PAS domain S-box-containing protein